MDTPPPDPIPAATLVVMREREIGPPELLMVERANTMAFAGGALVFPGGRIDPGDRALAASLDGTLDDLAARIAAIRETIEETGIAVGLHVDPAAVPLLRRRLHSGTPLGEATASLDLQALTPFARWCPRHPQARIFDTTFFLARLPADAPMLEVDATENVRAFWASADQVLADARAGAARIIFPTRRNLERLAQFASFEDAHADARAHPIRTITPWIERRGGIEHLCIPADLGYPIASEPLGTIERF